MSRSCHKGYRRTINDVVNVLPQRRCLPRERECSLLAFDFQRDVDQLVFLAADEFALTGPVQQLRGPGTP